MIERRAAKRYDVSTPLSGWSYGLGHFQGEIVNLSTCGVYIVADRAVQKNEQFVILLKIPELRADGDASLLWVSCRAVRVESAADGQAGVGVAAVVEEYVMPSRRLDADRTLERMVA